MAKVCTGCGLRIDADSNLEVASSTVYTDLGLDCDDTNGAPIYCDSNGELRSAPEKFSRKLLLTSRSSPTGVDVPWISLTGGVVGSNVDVPESDSVQFTNPSPCYPMKFYIDSGLSHAFFKKNGGGEAQVFAGARWEVTGDLNVSGDGGHQIWRHFGSVSSIGFDTQGATSIDGPYTIPPGGTVTFKLQPTMNIFSHTGANSTIQNWTSRMWVDLYHE